MKVQEININAVKVVENVRLKVKNLEGLMQDIKQHGLKQAIGVVTAKNGEYILVFGHRRLSACRKLGWKKIPANIYPDMELADLLVNNLGENLHREDPSPMELGRICSRLKEMEMNASEIAVKLSIPRSRVERSLDIYNNIPQEHRDRIIYMDKSRTAGSGGNISASSAQKILVMKRQYGLSEVAAEKLYKSTKIDDLSLNELNIISSLLNQGKTIAQALEEKNQFTFSRCDFIVNKKELEEAMNTAKFESSMATFQGIVYGELPPLKRPFFFNPRQKAKNKV